MTNLSLDDLLEDVFAIILHHTPHAAYPNLARVCRKLYDRVVPRLYHTVFYQGSTEYFDEVNLGLEHLHSQIYDIYNFFEVIECSPLLLSLVKEASFEWMDYEEGILKDVISLFESGQLTSLHLSLPVGSEFWPLPSAITSSITGLSVHIDIFDQNFKDCPPGAKLDRENFAVLFALPQLTHLRVAGVNDWHLFQPIDREEEDLSSTSNVTKIVLSCKSPMGPDLKDIVSWPKRLRSFRLFINSRSHDPAIDRRGPFDVVDTLHSQRLSLESLIVAERCKPCVALTNSHGSNAILGEFHALKWVTLPRSCLIPTDLHSQFGFYTSEMSLPARLETLRVALSDEYEYDIYDRYGGYDPETGREIDRSRAKVNEGVCLWLLDLARCCEKDKGALKRVEIWFAYAYDGAEVAGKDARVLRKSIVEKGVAGVVKGVAGVLREIGVTVELHVRGFGTFIKC